MLTWNDFFEHRLNEIFDNPKPPKNGHWYGSPDNAQYGFDSEKDPCPRSPCFRINFRKQGNDVVSVSFWPKSGGTTDRGKFAQYEIGNAVAYAVNDFVKTNNPIALSWFPVEKTSTDRNPEARKHIFATWMKRNMFPKYVPADPRNPDYPTLWVRRDVYDQEFTPHGYPIPDELKFGGKLPKIMPKDYKIEDDI